MNKVEEHGGLYGYYHAQRDTERVEADPRLAEGWMPEAEDANAQEQAQPTDFGELLRSYELQAAQARTDEDELILKALMGEALQVSTSDTAPPWARMAFRDFMHMCQAQIDTIIARKQVLKEIKG